MVKNQLSDIKQVVLDYTCGAGADVLACTLESSQLVLHVTTVDTLEKRLGERLQEVLNSLGMGLTVELRVQGTTPAFGTGVVIYDPLKIVASARAPKQAARWGTAALVALTTGGLSMSAAADLPAVSAPNGKIDVNTGNYDGTTGGALINGSFSMPLAHAYGLQIDGAAGEMIHENYNGIGVHAFWRNPEQGLVGLIASTNDLHGVDLSRVGAEARAYLGDFTVGVRGSRQNGDVARGDVARLEGSWYATENLMVDASSERAATVMMNKFTVEWQPQSFNAPGLAFFASTSVGGHNYDSTVIGARYYFGTNKTLKARHRTDDPESLVPDGSNVLVNQVYADRVVTPPAPPPPPPCQGYGCP